MAVSKKETQMIWEIITNMQHTAWVEGWSMGEAGGEKNRNPYPVSGSSKDVMSLYKIMRGEKDGR